MRTQFDIPTQPMDYLLERGPNCRGACNQGRLDCPHPMICGGQQLTADEMDDALAEMDHDTRPATLDDAKTAARGALAGAKELGAIACKLVVAIWRSP